MKIINFPTRPKRRCLTPPPRENWPSYGLERLEESKLERARRSVAHGEILVARQRDIVARLQRTGSSEVAHAQNFLAMIEVSLELLRQDLAEEQARETEALRGSPEDDSAEPRPEVRIQPGRKSATDA